ncbi:MAG TPA: TIR domain-containing protein [Actinobacteria bacterium]|nr:hypothetical protein BMS3Bbin01_02027 [bacterium BMS3Bbin01]HDL41423.1 TIR domain-containing protein [Actinomycetota bacterium]
MPPILEIYVLWHPGDTQGQGIADSLLEHFRGTPYSGLAGGAVEVYTRSAAWGPDSDRPRALPFGEPLPYGLCPSRITAVVPILGVRLARAAADQASGWRGYLEEVVAAAAEASHVGIFPVCLSGSIDGPLRSLLGSVQALTSESADNPAVLCRDLSQQIAQLVNDPFGDRLNVFISHTKRHSPDEAPDRVDDIVGRVRETLGSTHLRAYFDEADVQPGSNWDDELRANAASSALLAIRTDLYAGREWCQREFLIAKQAGMPIVTLNAVNRAEERGSFVMDHVPSVGYRDHDDATRRQSIEDALNLLVDGALRRAIWGIQEVYLRSIGFDWLPLHAPEPATLIPWLVDNRERAVSDGRVLVMHPDPPLGPEEANLVDQLFDIAGVSGTIDVVTPRTFASRGGREI